MARAAAAWTAAARKGVDSLGLRLTAIAENIDSPGGYTANQAVVDVTDLATRSTVAAADLLSAVLDVIAEVSEPLITRLERDFELVGVESLARVRLAADIEGLQHVIPAADVSFRPSVVNSGDATVTMVVAPPPAPDLYELTIELTDGDDVIGTYAREFLFP